MAKQKKTKQEAKQREAPTKQPKHKASLKATTKNVRKFSKTTAKINGGAYSTSDKNNNKERRSIIPPNVTVGHELCVQLFYVSENYALCIPCEYPFLKGKLSRSEVSDNEYNECHDMKHYYGIDDIVKVSVCDVLPPDRLEFSVRRVRKVLSDTFQPHTLAVFGVSFEIDERDLRRAFTKFGNVMDVEIRYGNTYEYDNHLRGACFVTLERYDDAMVAMKNLTRIEVNHGDETMYRTVKVASAHQQNFKEKLQRKLDRKLRENIERWNEMPFERRARLDAEKVLRDVIPWHFADMHTQGLYSMHEDFETNVVRKGQPREREKRVKRVSDTNNNPKTEPQ